MQKNGCKQQILYIYSLQQHLFPASPHSDPLFADLDRRLPDLSFWEAVAFQEASRSMIYCWETGITAWLTSHTHTDLARLSLPASQFSWLDFIEPEVDIRAAPQNLLLCLNSAMEEETLGCLSFDPQINSIFIQTSTNSRELNNSKHSFMFLFLTLIQF